MIANTDIELREMIYTEFLASSPPEDPTRTNVLLSCPTVHKELGFRILSTTEFRVYVAKEKVNDTSRLEENINNMPKFLRSAITHINILTPETAVKHLQLIHKKGIFPTSYKIMYANRSCPAKLRDFYYSYSTALYEEIFAMNTKFESIQHVALITRAGEWYETSEQGKRIPGIMSKRIAESRLECVADVICDIHIPKEVNWSYEQEEDVYDFVLQQYRVNGKPFGRFVALPPFIFTSDERGWDYF
jgi:hypothetical protein